MTLEKLYRNELDKAKCSYREKMLQPLENFKNISDIPNDLVELLAYQKLIESKHKELCDVHIPALSFDISKFVVSYYDSLDLKVDEEKEEIRKHTNTIKKQKEQEYEQVLYDLHNHNEALLNPFREKHESLLAYREDMSHVCSRYGISALDMNISDTITVDEFGALIDESLTICEKYKSKDNGLFNKAVSPLKGETNPEFVICYILMGIAVIYFLLPIVSVAVFAYMVSMVHGLYKDLEKLKIAMALMTQIDYNRFVSNDLLKPPEPLDLSIYDEEMSIKLSEVKDVTPDRENSLLLLPEESAAVMKECIEVTKEVTDEYMTTRTIYTARLNKVNALIEDKLKDYKPFPTVCSKSLVMSHDYTLGRLEDKLDVKATLPLSNVVFNCTNMETALQNLKLYLCNALLSVRVKQLVVDIYDPKNQGRDFAEFFSTETQDYIKPNSQPLDKLIEEFRSYTQENIKRLNHKDIDAFNVEAEEKEMVPLAYRLLIMVSEFDKWKKESDETGRVFKEFFKYSASNGVMIWLLDTTRWSGSVWVDGNYALNEGVKLSYDLTLGGTCMTTYENALSTAKDRGINYMTNFAEKYIPRDKWWSWNTVNGIELNFGLENGDPAKGNPITLDDGNVHCLCGGATGAGKSALISALLTSLITKYPPSELTIIYIDFKNSEANKLTVDGKSLIPHVRIISGTTDGEYALSIFEYLIRELTERQKICAKYKEVNLKDLRKRHPEVVIPRLLVLFDEFQVMYNVEYVPQTIIDSINGKITAFTKLARAYGGHLMFTSQSMTGTMSKDTMSNFYVRAALRCTKDVSDTIIGNSAAGTITAKFGYMYTNTSAGEDAKFNKFWRVPFIDVPDMLKIADELGSMCKETGEKHWHADFYDEKELVSYTMLDSWYNNYPDTFKAPEVFILGERSAYSVNKAPVTLTLLNESKENIMIGAYETVDLLNLCLTVMNNLLRKECKLIMHVGNKDSFEVLGVEHVLEPAFVDIARPTQDVAEFIDAIEYMVNGRIEMGGPYETTYVLCVQWEAVAGIGIEQQYKLTERLKVLLERAPTVGVHFIFAMKTKPIEGCMFIPNACAHRITGLMPDNSSFFTDCTQVEKLPDVDADKGNFAIYKYSKTKEKFRIYQNKFYATVKSREIFIE